jgi:site-specific recombinase XerD
MAEHVQTKRKPNTAALYGRIVANCIIPAIGAKKVTDVTKADVARLHHDLRDRPYLANRVLAVIGSLYTWAGRVGHVEDGLNPTIRLEKYAEDRRERFLTPDELERLGTAIREAETVGTPWSRTPRKR